MKRKILICISIVFFSISSLCGKDSKNLSVAHIISEQKRIETKIYEKGEEKKKYPEQELYPLTDGVADISEFLNRNYRVMFILKEGYDDFDEYGYPLGGGWMITAGDQKGDYPNKVSLTWRRIMQVSYGIFFEEKDFSKIPKIPSSFKGTDVYGRIIKSVAYINTNKMPAYKTSNDYDLRENFNFWKDILQEQMQLYDPEIVIFCGTYKFYKNSFSELFGTKAPSDTDMKINGDSNIVKGAFKDSKNRLFINAVHPGNGYLKGGDEAFFSDIIKVVNDYKKNKLKK